MSLINLSLSLDLAWTGVKNKENTSGSKMERLITESFYRFDCIILQDLHQINTPDQSFEFIQIDRYDVHYLRYVLCIIIFNFYNHNYRFSFHQASRCIKIVESNTFPK